MLILLIMIITIYIYICVYIYIYIYVFRRPRRELAAKGGGEPVALVLHQARQSDEQLQLAEERLYIYIYIHIYIYIYIERVPAWHLARRVQDGAPWRMAWNRTGNCLLLRLLRLFDNFLPNKFGFC